MMIFHQNPTERAAGKDVDPAMMTVESLAARNSLRAHPGIIDSIRRLASLYKLDADGLVTRDAYFAMHGIMARILRPEVTHEAALQSIAEDWERDRHGATRLDYSRQFAALFELVDTWCPGLAVEEYVSFVDALSIRVRTQQFRMHNVPPWRERL